MTKPLFLAFVTHFISEITKYRLQLPENLKEQKILLIVDGHSSRYTPEALILLKKFNIELLVLPPHCTHCVQPFDVAIASPLKTQFKKLIGSSYKAIEDDINFSVWKGTSGGTDQLKEKLTLDKLRHSMVLSFLDAMRCATTRTNCISAFKKSGIYPLDRQKPLNSCFTVDHAPKCVRGKIKESKHGSPGVLTENCFIEELIRLNGEQCFNSTCLHDDIYLAIDALLKRPKQLGKFITMPGPIYHEDNFDVENAESANDIIVLRKRTIILRSLIS